MYYTKIKTIFMSSKNSEIFDSHRLLQKQYT